MPVTRTFVQSEMPATSSRVWTWVTVYISKDDNRYTIRLYIYIYIYIYIEREVEEEGKKMEEGITLCIRPLSSASMKWKEERKPVKIKRKRNKIERKKDR